jgi:glucose/arabinose dehydrogenase
MRPWIVATLVAVTTTACVAGNPPSAPPSPSGDSETTASSAASTPPHDVRVRLRRIASVDEPLAMAVRTRDPALYIAEKTGRVVEIRDGRVQPAPVLDLSGGISLGSEQGLLGLVFSPDGRFLYVNYTDRGGVTHVTEFAMHGDRAVPASRRDVLVVDQPFSNHNGGDLVFGPDGYLYVGLGDGGSAGDPMGNGQSLATLLGKMLRIDPRPAGGHPYGIPADNPFVDRPGARPEIWAYGLRNPWRYSFDRITGDLWIGDVGQSAWEEIDRQPASSSGGENYGWNALEGTHPFDQAVSAPHAVPPIVQYPHGGSECAVTGGYVYRGSRIPDLVGTYLYADFCVGRIMALQGHGPPRPVALGPVVTSLSSFGEDQAGELYVLSLSGGVYELVA